MELTKNSINVHKSVLPGLEGYTVLVEKIVENREVHPDIAIESCKSLVEGLCIKALSLLSEDYNKSKNIRQKCKNKFPFLLDKTFDLVFSEHIAAVMHGALSSIIYDVSKINNLKKNANEHLKKRALGALENISAYRNERGDISHGRDYPKKSISDVSLSKSICSISDGICYFLIEQMAIKYRSKRKVSNKLNYEDLLDFNEWLDNVHNVLSIKVDFSKLLFVNAYEKYEEYYLSEYLPLVEEDSTSEMLYSNNLKIDDVIGSSTMLNDTIASPIRVKRKDLVTDYDESTFWDEARSRLISDFANEQDFDLSLLMDVVHQYLFTNIKPLRVDVVKAMKNRPKLKDLKIIGEDQTEKVISFVDFLKKMNDDS